MELDLNIKVVQLAHVPPPDHVFIFADPQWTGVWSSMRDKTNQSFAVRERLEMLPTYTLQTPNHTCAMGDMLKLYFYTQRPTRYEFRCACMVPIETLASASPNEHIKLSPWLCTREICDESQQFLDDVQVSVVVNRFAICVPRLQIIEHSVMKPNRRYNSDVKTVADWLRTALNEIYPKQSTGFSTMRTNAEAPFMTTFFSDLPVFFEACKGTSLPPTVAVYLMINALRLHGLTPRGFVDICNQEQLTRERLRLLLNVTRDLLCAPTMCRSEGRYEPDTCLGEATDHQPFKNIYKPGKHVFDGDDCEGRSQQGCIQIREMYIRMYLDDRNNRRGRVRAHFEANPPTSGCLVISDPDLLELLIEACCALGGLLESGSMRAQMAVGEAVFTSGQIIGHAFGILHYQNNGIVLEGTSWDRSAPSSRAPPPGQIRTVFKMVERAILDSEEEFEKKCAKGDTKQSTNACVRRETTDAKRSEIYRTIYTGHGCIFFEKGASSYGISPKSLMSELPVAKVAQKETAFAISLDDFLRALIAGGRGWPAREGAAEMLQIYESCTHHMLRYRHSVRPPPQPESEIMARAAQSWLPLGDADILCEDAPACERAFSWMASVEMPESLKARVDDLVASGGLQRHNCMRSRVFTWTPAGAEASRESAPSHPLGCTFPGGRHPPRAISSLSF